MTTQTFRYGPVELLVITLTGDPLDPVLWENVLAHVDDDTIRLLDVAVIRRSDDGAMEIRELTELGASPLAPGAAHLSGLIAEEDFLALGSTVSEGESAIVVAVEHRWATQMAERLASLGGRVAFSERIPAPAVNAVVAAAEVIPGGI